MVTLKANSYGLISEGKTCIDPRPNSNRMTHRLADGCPFACGGLNVQPRAASSVFLAKYWLGPADSSLACLTLPDWSTSTCTLTFTRPWICLLYTSCNIRKVSPWKDRSGWWCWRHRRMEKYAVVGTQPLAANPNADDKPDFRAPPDFVPESVRNYWRPWRIPARPSQKRHPPRRLHSTPAWA